MAKTIFLSYATPSFEACRDSLCASAKAVGFDSTISLGPADICQTSFWRDNQTILSQQRGAGFWLWKPFIISETLRTLNSDDVLVYCDAGRSKYYSFSHFPSKLAGMVRENSHGFLLGPGVAQHGPLSRWTKRDCLQLMDMDYPEIRKHPIIQATWSFWTPSKQAFDFLSEWLEWCSDPRCLTDKANELGLSNHPDFLDHRHDQSILTLLAYRRRAPYLDFSDSMLFRLLSLRPNSSLAHSILKRIDDAEFILRGKLFSTLIRSFIDSKKA